jgi:hypothetical protein
MEAVGQGGLLIACLVFMMKNNKTMMIVVRRLWPIVPIGIAGTRVLSAAPDAALLYCQYSIPAKQTRAVRHGQHGDK